MTKKFNYDSFKEKAIQGILEGKSFSGKDNVLLPMIKDLPQAQHKPPLTEPLS
jgi:hypothetical protein